MPKTEADPDKSGKTATPAKPAKATKPAPAKATKPTPAKSTPPKATSADKAPADKAPAKPAKAGGAKADAKPATKPAAKADAKSAVKTAAKAKTVASAEPAVPSKDAAAQALPGQEEENQLHKKLRLRAEDRGAIIGAPRDDDNPLLPLPASFVLLEQGGDLAGQEGLFDYIHVFARDRAGLIEHFALLRDKLAPGGSLWVSWLKQSSHRGGGQFGDLNENVVRRLGLTHALVDVKVAALDRNWSALRLVHRKR